MQQFRRYATVLTLGTLILLVMIGVMAPPTSVSAAGPWYVNGSTGSDSNDCLSSGTACKTIGGAIGKASSGDTINIAAGVYTEINSINGKSLTLAGAGVDQTIVDGAGSASNIFTIYSNASATISGMTLQNGSADSGAGIYAAGPITMSQVSLTNNTTRFGSLYVYSTTATIQNSSISGNHITISTDRDGIFASNNATLTIENSTLSGNQGETIHIQSGSSAAITNSTISGNGGNGISLSPDATADLNAVTIVNNSGFGLLLDGPVTITNSIIAHNDVSWVSGTENNCGSDYAIDPTSGGYNIDGGTSCNFAGTGDQSSTDPLLQPLADNGGDTQTHALSLNSPALDAGSPTTCPATDQRGTSRPQDGNGDTTATCDIGAFEVVRQAPTGVTISGDTSGLVNSSYAFVASTLPVTTTQPITYVWQATNQTPITHTGKSISDSVTFNWSGTGAQVITVTVNNGVGTQSDTHAFTVTAGTQAISGVSISGASSGSLGGTHAFTATVSPSNATLPITYSWQADGQSPVTHTGMGNSDSVSFHWTTEGTKTITVTATNKVGSQTTSHSIYLWSWYVDAATGDDANTCQSTTTACKTIGGAMGKASSGDTITIAAGVYTETNSINGKSLTLAGAGVDQTIVDGAGSASSIFTVNSNASATISGMTLQNGGADSGAGIYAAGPVTLSKVSLTNNTTRFGSLFVYNTTATIQNSSISGNHITISTDRDGIFAENNATLTIENSTLSGNQGETIHLQNGSSAAITNSTISGNGGNGISLSSNATADLNAVTIVNNSGIGLLLDGPVTIKNSIIAHNDASWASGTENNCGSNNATAPTSGGYNIDGGTSCSFGGTGDQSSTDPLLQPLADNGGDTWTHALLRASPALDGSDASVCPATDQRGTTRPIDGDGDGTATCDIGAFESPFVNWMVYLPLVLK